MRLQLAAMIDSYFGIFDKKLVISSYLINTYHV